MTDSQNYTNHDAIVVGGGIGGLTAALCLQHAGLRPLVLERAGELGEVGAGIQLSPNACRVLQAIDVLAAIEADSFEPEQLEMRTGVGGQQIFSIHAHEMAREHWGAPYLHVHRADLIRHLSQAVTTRIPDAIVTDAEVIAVNQSDDHATVKLADGREFSAATVIGADGIHSSVRQSLFGDVATMFTGNIAWRATVDIERLGNLAPPPSACVWVGPGRHAVTYRLRGGRLANIVAVVEQGEWAEESWTQQGDKASALADFNGWDPTVTTLLAQADEHYRWALFDRPPLRHWHKGRVVLLGDACHAMLPFLAQGAAMAIEDAWVLSASLIDGRANPMQRYTAARLARVQHVYEGARNNMHLFHRPTGLKQNLTHNLLHIGGVLAPRAARNRLDWLYGEDVTAYFPMS